MKAGWQSKNLAEVLLKTETVNPHLKPEVEFEYIDVSSVSNQTFQIEETQLLKGKDAPSRARKLVKTDDILFATIRPTLQRIAIIPAELNNQVCSTGYFVLRPNQNINFKYLYFYLFSDYFMGQMEALQKGASYPAVTDNEVKSQTINFPPIQQQQRIVAILDEAFEQIAVARANTEKNLQNARALFESHLQSAFGQRGNGWIRQKLGEVVTLDKIQHKPSKPLPYVGMEDIESNTGNFLGRHEPKKVKSSTFYFNDTHVIYGRLRPYLNKVMLPDFEGHCSTEVFPLKPCHKIDRKFLFFWLALNSTKELINATCTGARMPRANMNDVLEFDFYYPELASQKKLVLILEALSLETQCLESLYQRKLTALDDLKKSLLQKAFAGEL